MGWKDVERIAATFLGVIHLGFGIAIMVGGAIRFPPPTYQPLLDMTGGQVWPYGVAYLASGFLLSLPHHITFWGRMAGAALGVLANSSFTALFLVAVLRYPDAGATAWWAYLAFSTQSACLGALMWTHRRVRGHREG